MMLRIGDLAPDFEADTTHGPIAFHDWIGDRWCLLFSHPKDFTPVCTTELGAIERLRPEFERRGCRLIGISVDSVERHRLWSKDIMETQGCAPGYPLIGDTDLRVAKLYCMLPADVAGSSETRSAIDNATVRTVFFIAPDKRIRLVMAYPMSTGRNFAELLRALDSLQLTARHGVATPADWQRGEDVIIVPSIADDEARRRFPAGWRAPKPYLRIVPQPDR